MFSKLILCASPGRLVAGRWRFGRCLECQQFAADAEGREAFRDYLKEHKRSPVYLIANAAEEDYRVETMPHTAGKTREELLSRKLAQAYRNTQYRGAQFLGREASERREDKFLFMALNNAEIVNPWTTIIDEQQALLAGVFLLPVLTELMLRQQKIVAPDMLLISRQTIGLRQTFFQHGKLRLSRMTPLPEADDNSRLAEVYLSEAQKTQAYLSNQRLLERDAPLTLVVSGVSDDLAEQLQQQPSNFALVVLSASDVVRRFGVRPSMLQAFPELLHMQTLARMVPRANLAAPQQTRVHRLHSLRVGINFASLGVACTGALVAYSWWAQAQGNELERQSAQRETLRLMAEYQKAAQTFPATPHSADELRILAELAQTLEQGRSSPQRAMQVLGEVLDGQPDIQLNTLHWKFDSDTTFKDESVQSTQQASVDNAASNLREAVLLIGEVKGFHGDYRAAVAQVDNLVNALKQHPEVDLVDVLVQPINASAMATLQGSTEDAQSQQAAKAPFVLKLVLKEAKA